MTPSHALQPVPRRYRPTRVSPVGMGRSSANGCLDGSRYGRNRMNQYSHKAAPLLHGSLLQSL
ncbi:Uncharacterised protein [Vibrio cholerae]|nr:Uncharacterised protein [Vibrio cholerae]